MIPVTKPFLPPKKEYEQYIQAIWKRNWLTNDGPLVNELELRLKDYLDIPHLLYVSNGTIALQLAIKALDLKGEIITTPFSYVATTSSIVWENCIPVFVDIDEKSFNIDPEKIETAITEQTTAILATHVYGNPCEIDTIKSIAEKHHLKVIYDAAHCFGSTYEQASVLNYGDVSTISFHATKLFHTIEGGAVVTRAPSCLKKLAFMRNFGHDGPEDFNGVGINGKNSEFHAAMGLCNLSYVDHVLEQRRKASEIYDDRLAAMNIQKQVIQQNSEYNYAYYPIVVESEELCMKIMDALKRREIYARRYFYPVLSKLPYLPHTSTPVAEDIASRVLCLPLYEQLSVAEIDMICRIILRTYKYA